MREKLIACFQDTLQISEKDFARDTKHSSRKNKVYTEGFHSKKTKGQKHSTIIVESSTTFATAKKYLHIGKVAVLNFANPERPGGGVQIGAMAQEECLCRSSNLYPCISNQNVFKEYYQYNRGLYSTFYSDRLIYTPGVKVFKDDSNVPSIMPETEWFSVDVITCAAPYLAKRKYTNAEALLRLFKGRIKNVFEAARDNDVDVLILGAFGCGAFKNPPLLVSQAFEEIIREEKYCEDFKQIVFAIKPTGENCPNLTAFANRFDSYASDVEKRNTIRAVSSSFRFHKTPSMHSIDLSGNLEFHHWQATNRYFGKQFSILGDSISTLDGYNPRGYKVFYAGENSTKAGVEEMKDTWWDKVISFFGGELLVNNSWSGSRVTKLSSNESLFPSGCSDERTSSLHINTVTPDVIIVYLGTNDWAFGANCGDETRILGDDDHEYFSMAYDAMLKKIKGNYPDAEVWCCTLSETYMSTNPAFQFPHKHAGTHIEVYNDLIRHAVYNNKCKLIDLYGFHVPYNSIDGSHATADGMDTIAMEVIRSMADANAASFLDCSNAQHQFEVVEEYTGGTKYICKKCGKEKHTTTLFPQQEDNMHVETGSKQEHEFSRYSWGTHKVSEIKKMVISWGDLPIYHIQLEGNLLKLYRKINGSRDGWMSFPEGYFDEVKKEITNQERQALFQYLETIDFALWKTEERTIQNIEQGACGFCVSESFGCDFDNGTSFYCANPPHPYFNELVKYFKQYFPHEDMAPFHLSDKDTMEGNDLLTDEGNLTQDSDYVLLDSNITVALQSNTLRLTAIKSGETLQFAKEVITVGKDTTNDICLDQYKTISRHHATFFYENKMWFLRDDNSTNGTWLNGVRLETGKNYQLATNDEINFAMTECFIFDEYKAQQMPMEDADAKAIAFLEAAIATFVKSGHKDDVAFKIILSSLTKAPLYFPVDIDLDAMLGDIDPTKLKPGDTLQPNKDVKIKFLTVTLNDGEEAVAVFTSKQEMEKGESASVVRHYPMDFIPMLAQMNKQVIINPFSEYNLVLRQSAITDILLPFLEASKDTKQDNVVEKSDNLIGKIIDNRYEILQLVGKGGTFTVYLAMDKRTNMQWAVKVCDKNVKHPVIIDMAIQEVNIMKNLVHPAIPKIVDYIEDSERIYIVEEYVLGETLDTILTKNGAFAEATIIKLAKQLCSVLGYLHKHNPPYVYRDMKPANVFLQPDGNVKLVDFGITMVYNPSHEDENVVGTLGYAAPEGFHGRTTPRSDIYSLGVTLHQLVTGADPTKPPYEMKPIREINSALSRGLEAIIIKCTKMDPNERFQNCDELMAALESSTIDTPKKKSL